MKRIRPHFIQPWIGKCVLLLIIAVGLAGTSFAQQFDTPYLALGKKNNDNWTAEDKQISENLSSYGASKIKEQQIEELRRQNSANLVRGPYLQIGTPTSVVVRWRTDNATNSRVRYSTNSNDLFSLVDDSIIIIEHELTLSDLLSDTKYYYSVGSISDTLVIGLDYFFITVPGIGTTKKSRIWVLGDAGTAGLQPAGSTGCLLCLYGYHSYEFMGDVGRQCI